MPHEDACNNDSKLRVATRESGALGSAPERASSGTEDRISAPFPDCLPSIGDEQSWIGELLEFVRPFAASGLVRAWTTSSACRAAPIVSGLPYRAAHPMRCPRSTLLPSVTYRKDALASPISRVALSDPSERPDTRRTTDPRRSPSVTSVTTYSIATTNQLSCRPHRAAPRSGRSGLTPLRFCPLSLRSKDNHTVCGERSV